MSVSDKIVHKPSRMTARELLVEVAGLDHALHSVVGRIPDPPRGRLAFRCSCGTVCFAPVSEENKLALQNVVVEEAGKRIAAKGSG
jgi:hypothetical protein